MTLSNTAEYLPEGLAKAIANALFPKLDAMLRSGAHISADDLDNHSFLLEFHPNLELFYLRYQAELIKAPEGFFYLRPKSTTFLTRSTLSELDMLVGKVLCYLYLSPDKLANEGIFTLVDLMEELVNLSDEQQLLRMVNQRSGGSDLDRQKLKDKVKACLRKLKRIGMVSFLGALEKFSINEAIFRFGADVRSDEDPREVQLRLIQDGEAIVHDDETLPNHDMSQDEAAESEDQLGLEV